MFSLCNIHSLITSVVTSVQLIIHTIIQSANRVAAQQCVKSRTYRSTAPVTVHSNRMGGNVIAVPLKLPISWDFLQRLRRTVGITKKHSEDQSEEIAQTGWTVNATVTQITAL